MSYKVYRSTTKLRHITAADKDLKITQIRRKQFLVMSNTCCFLFFVLCLVCQIGNVASFCGLLILDCPMFKYCITGKIY